jgi:ATP-binding cassette subfamily B protein
MTRAGPLWARQFSLYARARRRLALGIILSALQTTTLLPVPLLIAQAIDTAIPQRDIGRLFLSGGAIVALTIASAVITLASRSITLPVTKRVARDLRLKLLDKLYSVSRQFHVVTDQGELHDRLVHETDRVDLMTSAFIAELLPSVVLTIGLLAILTIRQSHSPVA